MATDGTKLKQTEEETDELMQALERFEKAMDRAYDAGSHTVTVRFTDAVTVLRAVNTLLRVNKNGDRTNG